MIKLPDDTYILHMAILIKFGRRFSVADARKFRDDVIGWRPGEKLPTHLYIEPVVRAAPLTPKIQLITFDDDLTFGTYTDEFMEILENETNRRKNNTVAEV